MIKNTSKQTDSVGDSILLKILTTIILTAFEIPSHGAIQSEQEFQRILRDYFSKTRGLGLMEC